MRSILVMTARTGLPALTDLERDLSSGTGASPTAVRIELHLVSGSALVGHDELRIIARYAQATGFHLFYCPGPAITCFRLQQGKRQGRRLWIYDLCCY